MRAKTRPSSGKSPVACLGPDWAPVAASPGSLVWEAGGSFSSLLGASLPALPPESPPGSCALWRLPFEVRVSPFQKWLLTAEVETTRVALGSLVLIRRLSPADLLGRLPTFARREQVLYTFACVVGRP